MRSLSVLTCLCVALVRASPLFASPPSPINKAVQPHVQTTGSTTRDHAPFPRGARGAPTSATTPSRELDSFANWEAALVHPPRVEKASAILDPVRRRMLVFGGYTGLPACVTNDVWALGMDGPPHWTSVPTTGTRPDSLWRHSAIYDPVRDRMIVFGGIPHCSFGLANDVWSLSLSVSPGQWTRVQPAGP